jgi:hypothetical protein
MRRPNPWIALPSLVLGLVAGWLGWTITSVTCRYRDADGTVVTCPVASSLVAVGAFVLATGALAVVLVLVYRSLAEWRDQQESR